MKRWIVAVLALMLGVSLVSSAYAVRRVVVHHGPHGRTRVVVHEGWPLHRAPHVVVVRPYHPARTTVRVAPGVFLAPIVFTGVVVATRPAHDVMVWEDTETLHRREDWTEFTLDCEARGAKLYIDVEQGKAQVDWAEVVFANGDTRVVDFTEKTYGPGLYPLLDFADGRKVDHVRMVARARSEETRVGLEMQKLSQSAEVER